jgi:hypothetical protein
MKFTLQNSANGLIGVLIVAFGSVGISGGPVYPVGMNIVGTYAGAMTPAKCGACNSNTGQQVPLRCSKVDHYVDENSGFAPCTPDDPNNPGCAANSQGIFSVTVPDSGVSSGTFVMFSQGRVFSGTIQGTADSGRQTMAGVLHATFDFTVTDPNTTPPTTTSVTAEANGNLNAKITQRSSKGIRLAGTSSLDISEGMVNPDFTPLVDCHMSLSVSGFKQ